MILYKIRRIILKYYHRSIYRSLRNKFKINSDYETAQRLWKKMNKRLELYDKYR